MKACSMHTIVRTEIIHETQLNSLNAKHELLLVFFRINQPRIFFIILLALGFPRLQFRAVFHMCSRFYIIL